MAEDLDKFVLRYEVQLGNVMLKLDELDRKLASVNDRGEKGTGSMTKFRDINGALARELPASARRVEHLVGAFARFGPVGAGVLATVVGIGVAMKVAVDQAAELNRQADRARVLGTTPLRMEQFARNLSVGSGGKASYKDANDIYDKVGSMMRSAYIDPYQNNRDAWKLRMAGVSVNNPNGGIGDTDTAVRRLAQTLSSVSDDQAQFIGQEIGLSRQQVEALRDLNSERAKEAQMTQQERDRYVETQIAAQEFANANGRIGEAFRQLGLNAASMVLPALDEVENGIANFVESLAVSVKNLEAEYNVSMRIAKGFAGEAAALSTLAGEIDQALSDIVNSFHEGGFNGLKKKLEDDFSANPGDAAQAAMDQFDKKWQSNLKAEEELQKYKNQSTRDQVAEFDRMMNLFSSAVNKFSDAVDEREVMAEWAGAIGAAGGLSGSGSDVSERANTFAKPSSWGSNPFAAPWANIPSLGADGTPSANDAHQYDSAFIQAGQKFGVDPVRLKQIAMEESKLNPGAVSPKGASGIMQLDPSNFASTGVTNWRDPYQNIMAGAQIFRQMLDLAHQKGMTGDAAEIWALRAYNGGTGGPDSRRWKSAENQAYVARVMSQRATLLNNPDASQHAALLGAGKDNMVLLDGPDLSKMGDPGPGNPFGANNPMADAYDPKAQPSAILGPGHHTVAMNRTDGSVRGRSYDTQQYEWMEQEIAKQIGYGVTPAMLAQGAVSKGDIRWAEGNMLNQMKIQESAQAAQLAAMLQSPGVRPEQVREAKLALASTGAHVRMMQAYGDQIAARGKDGDRSLTLGQMRTPNAGMISAEQMQRLVEINVYGAQDDRRLAEEIRNILHNELSDLANSGATAQAR